MRPPLFFCAVILALPLAAPAQTPSVAPPPLSLTDTTVSLVQTEATGKDTADAKATAIRQGARDAFRQLIHKLYPDRADTILANAKPEQIEGLLQDKQVENEKIAGTHYEAVLTYRFSPQKIQALSQAITAAAVTDSAEAALNTHSVLLIPALKSGDLVQLWEEENSWRKSWNHVALQIGRGQLIVPYGDRRDREEIGAEEAQVGGFKEFTSIAQRYGVREVYVAIAEYQSTDLSLGVQVVLRKLSATGATTETLKYDAHERETRDEQLERAALELARRLTRIKGMATESYQTQRDSEITLQIQHDGFKDFQKICGMLEAIPNVRRLQVGDVSYYRSTVTLLYRTSPELLGKSFAAKGFRIYKQGAQLLLALPQ